MLTMIYVSPRDDYPDVEYYPEHLTDEQVREECERMCVEYTPSDPWDMASELRDQSIDDCLVEVMPTAEYEKQEASKQRSKLEKTASSLAQRHGIEVNSLEFLDLLDRLIDQSRSYREGMKEDGLCIGWGVTPEQWYDEYNASSGDECRIDELRNWMLENLPLLCAQYTERMTADV